ncbi:hypothetical protein EDD11_004591 [Mortierella claussenii]|nr:hypothetical protein EDD11_004591 [Mortierella claussenii]
MLRYLTFGIKKYVETLFPQGRLPQNQLNTPISATMSSSKRKKTVSTANMPSIIKNTTTTTIVTYTCVDLDEHSRPAKSAKKNRTSVIKAPATLTHPKTIVQHPIAALKAEFIAEVNAARENDPKASASSIGRDKKYNLDRFTAACTINNSKAILDKVEGMGPRSSTKMTKLYPRAMEVVEKVLFLQFKHEIDSDSSMAPKPIQFSDGWLTTFKRNYGIRMYVGHDKEGDVDIVKHGPQLEQKMVRLRKAAQGTENEPAFSRDVAMATREYLDI